MSCHKRKGISILCLILSLVILPSFVGTDIYATSDDEEKRRLQEIQEKSALENPPEEGVIIENFRLHTSNSYGMKTFDIDGQIRNDRSEELFGVQITATFYDQEDKFLGSEVGYVNLDPLPPGQLAPFKINLMSGGTTVPMDDIGSIKFRVTWMNPLGESVSPS